MMSPITIASLLFGWLTNSAAFSLESNSINNVVGSYIPSHENGIVNGISPSPKCWQSAITLFQPNNNQEYANDAAGLCAIMPEAHQKRLALEISQCHLNDLGKSLYREEGNVIRDCSTATVDIDTVLMCLKHLTPAGENSYTIYLTYVQNLCTRLTQEILLKYQQEAQQDTFNQVTSGLDNCLFHAGSVRDG
jgi:hypothetical protein